jgi:hypothetical protein
MTALTSRRSMCLGLVCLGIAAGTSTSRAIAGVRPFFRFSLREGWTGDGPSEYITRKAGPDDASGIPQVVRRITRILSIDQNFDVYIAQQEDNAFATVAGGRKILVVDVGFLEKLNRMSRTEWGAIQVIAHEIGHHIAGFSADRHRSELNADYWSGQSLQRLGSSRTVAASAILAIGTELDTPTHPNSRRRAATIEHGWNDASHGKIDYSFCDDCR